MSRFSFSTYNENVTCDESPDECPLCHLKIEPLRRFTAKSDLPTKGEVAQVIFQCPNAICQEYFIATYWPKTASEPNSTVGPVKIYFLSAVAPKRVLARKFTQDIELLSPSFCTIYKEAAHAEDMGLTQICGGGFRKALEFLIKDYLIELRPQDADESERPTPKGGGFELRLKAGSIGPLGR
jgi:hypothetical protein